MKKLLFVFMLSLLMVSMAWGQSQLLVYAFENNANATSVASNINPSEVTVSTGSISYQNGTDGGGTKIAYVTEWPQTAFLTSGKYLQFSLNPADGYNLSLTSMSFKFGRTSTGPTAVTVQYSLDNFNTNGTTIVNNQSITSTATNSLDLVSVSGDFLSTSFTSTITFRIWGHNASGTGNLRFNDFTVNGSVSAASISAPTEQASNITFSAVGQNQMTVNWTNGNGAKRVVKMNTSNSFTTPDDGTDPTANAVYGGSGEQVVYNNNGSSVTVTGLNASSTYWFRVYEYNGAGTGTKYLGTTATNNPNSQSTLAPPPDAPEATAASNIDEDSFTANWGSVFGATGYRLDVFTGGGTTELVNTGFEGYTSFPTGWTQYSSYVNNKSTEAYAGTYYAGMNAANDYFYTPLLASPTTISFWIRGSSTTANNTTKVQYSSNASTWTDIATFSANGSDTGDYTNSWTQKTINANLSGSYYIRWFMSQRSAGSAYFDDVLIVSSGLEYLTGFENIDVSNVTSYEVTGLDPETTYYYVVRAYDGYSQTSLNSNEIEVTTIAAITYDITPGTPATYGNEGAETSITITGGGFVGANIISEGLTPAANAAFITSSAGILQLIGTGSVTLSFTPAAGDTWFTYSISGGDWVVIDLSDSATVPIEIIVNLGSKDAAFEFKSGTGGDPTLPVELSTFTVSLNSFNNAVLNWVTQTETGVSGFYVYRNNSENLASAILVSNLIPATNSSEEHSYSFTDKELFSHGTYYYWLQVADIDGSESYHGPATLVYTGDNEPALPSIPTVTELRSIFPNPFNPNTNLSYSLAEEAEVSVKIYNARGQLVRTLNEGRKAVGHHSAAWDGKDDRGQNQSTGVYFFRMQAGKKVFNSKAVLMK